ncbi:DUF1963 domain-containing protein [Roseobacter sp. CCS2]|uniref:DUF1963 domain-containing protein n=1 Tax=Roseobacter sp. CCS2 TaxID=391593 RepID=UPI0000F3E528|nr:DUF1963 domain-containing protein [Roseobacter sp. CCS2]EBA10963.1 hypothetical protein RCCS2_00739 [Roseobacter sp. CCS2]
MVFRFFKVLVWIGAIFTIGLAIHAETTQDGDLRLTALSLLSIVVAAAFALGMFRGAPKGAQSTPKPLGRPTYTPKPAQPAEKAKPEPRPELEEDHEEIKDDELYIVFSRLAGYKTGEAFRDNVDKIVAANRLAPLPPEDIERLAKEIDRRDLRGKTFVRTPGVALVRLQRFDLDVEFGGTSWLGGLPILGDTPWPRDELGRAMHHLAQIDLGTVPNPLLPEGMPTTGAMAFFMTTATDGPRNGKVIYLPTIGNTATEPPRDLVPIYDGPNWGYYVKGHARENAPDTFPRWPVEFVLLPLTDQKKDDDAHELIADLLPHQSSEDLSPTNYRKSLPEFARPWFWDTAHRFTMSIRLARDDIVKTIAQNERRVTDYGATYEPALYTLLNKQDEFSAFVDEVSIWAVSHEPWDRMLPDDVATLERYFAQVRDIGGQPAPFKPFYQFTQGELLSGQEATTATLVAAANASPDVFAELPFIVRDDIDTKYRIASKGRWHQMFGLGSEIQTAVSDHTHHHLLLQLHSDQLVNWMWGDKGVVQFWITEEDMIAQNWDAVEMTLESN